MRTGDERVGQVRERRWPGLWAQSANGSEGNRFKRRAESAAFVAGARDMKRG